MAAVPLPPLVTLLRWPPRCQQRCSTFMNPVAVLQWHDHHTSLVFRLLPLRLQCMHIAVQTSPPSTLMAQRADSSSTSQSISTVASSSSRPHSVAGSGPRPPQTPPPAETKQAQARWQRSKRQRQRGNSNECCLIIEVSFDSFECFMSCHPSPAGCTKITPDRTV